MIKTPPRFSVITITYDNQDGLAKTAQSLAHQSFTNYEWIVIDGASNATLPGSIQPDRINHISEPDSGIYDAMNKGIYHAKGDYIIFMNAGDQFASETTLAILAKSNADFIYGDALENDKGQIHYKKARKADPMSSGMFTHHQAMIYKMSFIKNLRYNNNYEIAADYDFTLRFLKNVQEIHYIERPICIFESGGVSQIKVKQARKEQFSIRQSMNYSVFQNMFIFFAQTIIYRIRQLCPKIYWLLKRQRQADNI